MRKTKLLLVAFLAMLGSSVYAEEYEIDQKFTSIADLDGKCFAIVNEGESTAMGIGISGHGNGWDMYFGTYTEAYVSNACYYKLEAVQTEGLTNYYYLRTYKSDGSTMYTAWGNSSNMGYFNSQPANEGVCFALGLNNQNGQDGKNLAVWAIEESDGKFALKNIGTELYLKDSAPAKYEEPTYFTFCTLKETEASIVARYKARYAEIKPLIEALDDDASIFDGDATVDFTDADAALEAATTTEDVDAAIELLYKAATTFVTSVTVKEGKYFDLSNIWIVNPTVRKNISGWTAAEIPGGQRTGNSWGVCNYDECEFYQQNFDFYQTLTLPKGTYEFGVTGFHRSGNHSSYFYAGEDRVLIPGVPSSEVNSMAEAQTYFNNGNGKLALKFALEDASNTMKIGIINTDTETDRWTIFRDFTLHYYGSTVDYSVYTDRWAELIEEATTAMTNHPSVTGTEYTSLDEAMKDAPGADSKKADYIAKIGALETALNAFNAAASSYDKYVAYRAETVAAFGEELAATVDAPTTAAEAAAAVQNLNIAQYNKVANDYKYSATGLIGDFGSWTGTATYGEDKTPSTPNYLSNEHWSGQTHAYYEQCKEGWGNTGGWTIKYEKTCTLPAGDYVIKVAARSAGAGVTSLVSCTATTATVTLPAESAFARGIKLNGEAGWSGENSEYARDGVGFGWQWRFLPFTLDAETEVTMTFYAEASSVNQWMSIADGELLSKTKVAEDVAYDEAETNTIEYKLVADVTMARTIKVGYNTVVLPFDATANQVAEAFGEGTVVYAFSEASENAAEATVNFNMGDGSITANTPVLIKATAESSSQVFKGVQIKEAEAKVAGTNFDFVGTYAPVSALAEGNYFVGNGALYKSAGETSLNAFRAYIAPKAAGARIAKFFIDGVEIETTGIEGVKTAAANNGKIYNLAGQEVKNAQKGLYIQNGKKFVVK